MRLQLKIEKGQERAYPRLAFDVPADTERIDVRVSYPRAHLYDEGGFTRAADPCVLDLALEAPDGTLVGAAGSDRDAVFVSPLGSSAGFRAMELPSGRWHVIAGAYRVPVNGVEADYEITLTPKRRRLFTGDTHAHTLASDGVFEEDALVALCRKEKLDFLFVTDHNNVCKGGLYEDVTVLPGVEWTHYNGHAGFLGCAAPLPGRYDVRGAAEAEKLMRSAHEQGAFVTLNHPFCPLVPWLWGFDVPFDGMEVWNGVMSERNERAVAFWHQRLCEGARIPATGGSDFHRPGLLGSLGMPCTCLYALSRSPKDLMVALARGAGFIRYLPEGPGLDLSAEGGASFGDTAACGEEITFSFTGLLGGDELRLITDVGTERIGCPADTQSATFSRRFLGARFVRAELYRAYAPGLPPMKALLGNPVYFA